MMTAVGFLDPNSPSRFDDKFDAIVRWYNDDREDSDERKIKLTKPLREQYDRWLYIYSILSLPKIRFKSDTVIILKLKDKYPDLSDKTLRQSLNDTRRFFAQIEEPVLAHERIMLITNMKRAMEKAEKKGDMKSLGALYGHYIKVIGADKTEAPVDNRTIINILNYNPEQLGGKQLSDDQIEAIVQRMLADDKKKDEELFDSYEDVSPTK